MLEKWLDIQRSPDYWEYSPQDRAAIKNQWFSKNVANTKEFQEIGEEDKTAIFNSFSR